MNDGAVANGAEAEIYETEYLGYPAVIKTRSPKKYRHPELDDRIRSSRIKNEARLIRDARLAGVRTPAVYDTDLVQCKIIMERISGEKIKDFLDDHPEKAETVCRMIGESVAKLHNAGISHGDLTTSNMIMTDEEKICFIDFSMGASKVELEDMGVDIRLLERSFVSAHPLLKEQYDILLGEYCKFKSNSDAVMKKVEEIRERGRYT